MIDLNKPLKDLEHLKLDEALKQKTLEAIYRPSSQKKNYFFPILVSVCVVLLIIALQIPKGEPLNKEVLVVSSYVSIDLNPSMTLELDKDNKVIKTKAFNDEAKALLKKIDMCELPIEEALNLLMTNSDFQNYLDQGFLQVSIYSEDKTKETSLETMLKQQLSSYLQDDDYSCVCASQKHYQEAKHHHMSFGKYQMIEMIIDLDSDYKLEDLKKENMRTLKTIYESLTNTKEDTHTQHHQRKRKHQH